jgi:hypothetical protein
MEDARAMLIAAREYPESTDKPSTNRSTDSRSDVRSPSIDDLKHDDMLPPPPPIGAEWKGQIAGFKGVVLDYNYEQGYWYVVDGGNRWVNRVEIAIINYVMTEDPAFRTDIEADPVYGIVTLNAVVDPAIAEYQSRFLTASNAVAPLLMALLDAGKQPDRGGLTRAGRALEKHGGRVGSVFPKATGNTASKNVQGQSVLEDILLNTNNAVPNRFGGFDYYGGKLGGGARFDKDGNFKGFLEP